MAGFRHILINLMIASVNRNYLKIFYLSFGPDPQHFLQYGSDVLLNYTQMLRTNCEKGSLSCKNFQSA